MRTEYHTLYEPLPWDTSLFNYKVARITVTTIHLTDIENLLVYLKNQDYRLLYWSVKPEDINLNSIAKQAGGLWIDEKVTYAQQLSIDPFSVKPTAIIPYTTAEPYGELIQLAWQSGAHSRFKRDPNFVNNEFKRLYSCWLQNSLLAKSTSTVLIYQQTTAILGFITLEINKEIGQIGLLAVAEPNRRTGIGRQLLQAAFQQFAHWDCPQIQIITQKDNQAACAFYEKNGFSPIASENVFHFWL